MHNIPIIAMTVTLRISTIGTSRSSNAEADVVTAKIVATPGRAFEDIRIVVIDPSPSANASQLVGHGCTIRKRDSLRRCRAKVYGI